MQILTNQREIYTEESGATLCLAVTDVPPSRPLAQLLHTSFPDPSHSRKLPPPPRAHPPPAATRLARPAWFVPETTSLREQLNAFRVRRDHLALVVDEYGSIMGLVTLEDIIEEIVGDIAGGRRAARQAAPQQGIP